MTADPTYGRIDADIQRTVDEMNPPTLGSRVAMENTLQARRDAAADRSACGRCGRPIRVMAFLGDGYCSVDCAKGNQ